MAIDERLLLTDPVQERNAEFQVAPGKRVWVNKKWSPPSPTGSSVGVGGGPLNWKDPQGNTALSAAQPAPAALPRLHGGVDIYRPAQFPTADQQVRDDWASATPGTGQSVGVGREDPGSNTAYDPLALPTPENPQPQRRIPQDAARYAAPPPPTRIPQDNTSYGAYAGGGGGGFKAERAAPAPAPTAPYDWKSQYGQENLAPQQFGAESVATGVAADICGPIAAVAFARATGRNPTIAEAVAMAKGDPSNGVSALWDAGTGMYGPANEQTLLTRMGVSSRLEGVPSKQRVIQDLLNGNPVILSSPGHYHYFVATGYDPATDTFDTGDTGNIWKNPALNRTWRTWEDIGPQAALYIDEPSSPAPSVAVGNEGVGHGADPVQAPLHVSRLSMQAGTNDGSTGPSSSDQQPIGSPPQAVGGYPAPRPTPNAWEAPASVGASSGRQATPQQAGGYTYVPQAGDDWSTNPGYTPRARYAGDWGGQPSVFVPTPDPGSPSSGDPNAYQGPGYDVHVNASDAPARTSPSSGRQAGPMTKAPVWPPSPSSTARSMPTPSPGYRGDVPDMRQPQPTQGQQLQQATAWVPTPTVPAGGPPVDPTDQRTWVPGVTDQPGWAPGLLDPHWQPPLSQAPNGGTTLPGGTLGVRPENVTRVLAGNGAS